METVSRFGPAWNDFYFHLEQSILHFNWLWLQWINVRIKEIIQNYPLLERNETYLWSGIEVKICVFVVLCQVSRQHMTFRCVVTVDYGHFPYCRNSRVGSNQNVRVNQLNLVLLCALWQIQNRYKNLDITWSIFSIYLACNLIYILYCKSDTWQWWERKIANGRAYRKIPSREVELQRSQNLLGKWLVNTWDLWCA